MCMVDGGERADFYSVAKPIARRDHRCGECGRTIMKGEQYERHTMAFEGTASTHLVCAHCAVLTDWLVRECGGALIGQVIADIEEHATDYLRRDLAALGGCARNKWVKGPSFQKPFPGIKVPQCPPPIGKREANMLASS